MGSSGEGNAIGLTLGSISSGRGGNPEEEDGDAGPEEDKEERTRGDKKADEFKDDSIEECEGKGDDTDEGFKEEKAGPVNDSFPPSLSSEAE